MAGSLEYRIWGKFRIPTDYLCAGSVKVLIANRDESDNSDSKGLSKGQKSFSCVAHVGDTLKHLQSEKKQLVSDELSDVFPLESLGENMTEDKMVHRIVGNKN